MQQNLLPTGRVQYFPTSEYLGNGRIRDSSGTEHAVDARRIVDATFMRTVVPSMRPPAFPVAAEFRCVPPNDVPAVAHSHERFVVIGAGKTGIDVCLWLLEHGIVADRLTWIMPRDSWLLDRANLQPGQEFAERFRPNFVERLAAIEQANSVADLFENLENNGNLLRIDPTTRPTMYRCATVSRAELAQLRRIGNVVRHGRVERIEDGEISLTNGALPADPSALYVDCTADALQRRPPRTVFSDDHITLQSLRGCQQVFSASLIAHVETT